VHERYRQTDRKTYRQTTDGRATAYSKREYEFTFANYLFLDSESTTMRRLPRLPWMNLNVVMALILRYFTEFGSFPVALRKSGW